MPDFIPNSITPAQVVAEARRLLGAPYKPLGRGIAGIDCLNTILVPGIALGQIPANIWDSLPAYGQNALPKFLPLFWTYLEEMNPADVVPGCGYLLSHNPNPTGNQRAKHVCFCTEVGILGLSLLQSVGKVAEHSLDKFYEDRIVTGWRFRGLIL